MHVAVVTVAHRGDDARIVHRQARSLLEAGHKVTLVAPPPPALEADPHGLVRVEVPRASGRRRVRSWRAALRAVRVLEQAGNIDLLLIHDPELIPLLARRSRAVPVVWDVHEDYSASVSDRRYVPPALHLPLRWVVERLEALAKRRCHLLLAENSYADRLGPHPVIPNATWVNDEPAPFDATDHPPRVVYLGRIARSRGAHELIELGRRLHGRVVVQLIGEPDADLRHEISRADSRGDVSWLGYLPNPEAVGIVCGSLAGLSLLHDTPNYRGSRPTKVVEYLAQAVPVITTNLPLAAQLVEAADGGAVVPFENVVSATMHEIEDLLDNPERRVHQGASGHAYVRCHHAWQSEGDRFVALLESWARGGGRSRRLNRRIRPMRITSMSRLNRRARPP